MTDEPQLPRFVVRRGAWRDWMVWDRHTKGPAKYQGHPVVGLSQDDGAARSTGQLPSRKQGSLDLAMTRENVCPVTGLVSKNFSDFKTMPERFSR
jgi:hypothetical protein